MQQTSIIGGGASSCSLLPTLPFPLHVSMRSQKVYATREVDKLHDLRIRIVIMVYEERQKRVGS